MGLAVPFPYASVGFRQFSPGRYQPLPGGVLLGKKERCLMEAIFAIIVVITLAGVFGQGDKEVERDYSVDRTYVQKEDGKW